MRLFIDSDTVFDVGDRVRAKDGIDGPVREGTVVAFVVTIELENGGRFATLADDVELIESASDMIRGWTRENEIRQYADAKGMSIVGALALLVNKGLSHL